MTDTEELRRLAEQAKNIPHALEPSRRWLAIVNSAYAAEALTAQDAAYIAAASPGVVLRLLDELRSASGMSGRLVEVTGKLADTEADRDSLKAERDALAAALRNLDDAAQYGLAFLNDPEGLQSARDEWRQKIRTAINEARAILAQHVEPAAATAATETEP